MTTPIRFAELQKSPWPNGAGRKADIAAGPIGADGKPDWLLAYAWLDGDAPFSDYTGHDRTITLVSGVGFVLDFADAAPPVMVDAPFRPRPFDGDLAAHCRLPAGPCLVLNAMSRRGPPSIPGGAAWPLRPGRRVTQSARRGARHRRHPARRRL